jgi:hypothetical protein
MRVHSSGIAWGLAINDDCSGWFDNRQSVMFVLPVFVDGGERIT